MKIRNFILAVAIICIGNFINDATGIIENKSSTLIALPWMPCEPDCPLDSFETGGLHSYDFVLGGCTFSVDYYYRYACDTWCDFNIYRVQLKDSMCINTYTVDFLLDYAMIQLIQFAPESNCNLPGNNECQTSWRVNNAGCMYRVTNPPYYLPETGQVPSYFSWQTIFPCDGSTCCFRVFKACRDAFGNLTILPVSVSSSGTCPQIQPGGHTCYDTCN